MKVTHEGTNWVKESKIDILVHKFELFRMESNEYITKMFTRITNIISGLKSLGKSYLNSKMVRKLLRLLPRTKEVIEMVIHEAKNLNKLPLGELLRSLMMHALTKKQNKEVESKKKMMIALKSMI